MFFAGDEFLNSQQGNNNAYCQDNEISWLNWSDLARNREHFEFVKFMIAFRKAHDPVRRSGTEGAFGLPPVLVMKPGTAGEDGSPRTGSNILCIIYSGKHAEKAPEKAKEKPSRVPRTAVGAAVLNAVETKTSAGAKKESPAAEFVPELWDDAAGIAVNVFWEPQEITLPELPEGVSWYAAADTSGALIPEKCAADGAYKEIRGRKLTLGPRSVIVFTARA